MTYKDQLSPWCIIRHLPNLQHHVVARTRRRSDAEAHVQILRRLMPTFTFSIIFDVTLEPASPAIEQEKPRSNPVDRE